MTLTVEHALELKAYVGQVLGTSGWIAVTQRAIDDFARLSGDDHWIHVDVERARGEMPEGRTIAHGLYLLSLVPVLQREIYAIRKRGRGLNYGYDRLRFVAPVPVGSHIRLRQSLARAAAHAVGTRLEFDEEIEIEGREKPALVARHILLIENP
ncbi:MaoC family dehydratase [Chelativorans sp. AA-79]|uniref:MaoC family dehydratase n=1 Tax=Chelativorans sp. AA-79 TaxID=3028735 RepID=UPI0023F7D730|nr:MaoC family dehydratase [Chelativorans sp. AA-79]WEX10936.1 MaoC family dehydratase [Chelativorans sp. AA-79]